MHFMSVYVYTGADVHQDAQHKNGLLLQDVFDYASIFGNNPIYIGMDANTDTCSSHSLSQVDLSQRWFDIGSLFPQLKHEVPQPTCFAKGNSIGRRSDFFLLTPLRSFQYRISILIPMPLFQLTAPSFLLFKQSFSLQISRDLLSHLLITLYPNQPNTS